MQIVKKPPSTSHPPKAHSSTPSSFSSSLLLQQLRHFKLDVEELGCAAVDAHALALVDLALAVISGNALLHAGLLESLGAR